MPYLILLLLITTFATACSDEVVVASSGGSSGQSCTHSGWSPNADGHYAADGHMALVGLEGRFVSFGVVTSKLETVDLSVPLDPINERGAECYRCAYARRTDDADYIAVAGEVTTHAYDRAGEHVQFSLRNV